MFGSTNTSAPGVPLQNVPRGTSPNYYPTGPGIGAAIGRVLGFDITPGFNVTNPFVNNSVAPTVSKQTTTTSQPTGNQDLATVGTIYGTGNGTGATSNWAPTDEATYQAAYQQAQNSLGRLPGQLNTALSNVNNQYNQQYNGLQSGLAKAKDQYGQDTTTNQQDKLSNTNLINQGAVQNYQSILRMLGGMGAGGGSEAQFLVPQLVQQSANQQLGGAGQTFAKNARTLDTNFNNYTTDNENQQKQLNDWKTQQVNSARSQSAQSEQGIQQQLAQLLGQRAAARGGNGVAAQQPYIDKINQLSGTIDSLQGFNPTFNGTTPVYQAPSLDSYTASDAPQAQVAPTAQGGTNPYLALLMGQQQQKKDQQIVA